MERFIVKYNNGEIRQQRGINTTYYHLLNIGVVNYIIDTKHGEIMASNKEGIVSTVKITEYNDSDLITPND